MKKRTIAVLLSGLVFPGAGQLYNRNTTKGVLYVLISLGLIIFLVAMVAEWMYQVIARFDGYEVLSIVAMREFDDFRVRIFRCVAGLFVVWIASIVDAYVIAGNDGKDKPTRPLHGSRK